MKNFVWAFLFMGCSSYACAQNNEYTLDTAPWSDKQFEVCPVSNNNGLRTVIFEPEIEEWSYTENVGPSSRLKIYEKGIKEVEVVSEKLKLPAYYLKEQKIGYLNVKGNWVDKHGKNILKFDQLESIIGEKLRPNVKTNYEKYVYKTNFELEHTAAMRKIQSEQPCTIFSVINANKLELEFHYDFGPNNPYQCDAEIGFKRSQKFDFTKKVHRPTICCPDGSNYYVKFPNGDIKTYRGNYPIWEVLYSEDGSQICEWKDLDSLNGYDLIVTTQ